MTLHPGNIETIQKPVQLLAVYGQNTFGSPAPMELFLFQSFLPETKTIALPVQNLHFVPVPVREHEKLTRERVPVQVPFDQCRQADDALAKIDRTGA